MKYMWNVCIIWGTIYVINKKIQDQRPLPCTKTMAHGKGTNLCRVPEPRHMAKIWTLLCATSAGHTANIWPHYRCWLATLFCHKSRMALGKPFAMCPIYSTRQRPALPMPGCRVRFVVCGTRQRVCRGLLGLYRVPLAHGKGGVSRSEHRIVSAGKSRMACQYITEVLLMSLTA